MIIRVHRMYRDYYPPTFLNRAAQAVAVMAMAMAMAILAVASQRRIGTILPRGRRTPPLQRTRFKRIQRFDNILVVQPHRV